MNVSKGYIGEDTPEKLIRALAALGKRKGEWKYPAGEPRYETDNYECSQVIYRARKFVKAWKDEKP